MESQAVAPRETAAPIVEARSFDYVPPEERHGSLWSQTQLWFMVNSSFLTAATGALGVLARLSLTWGIVAIVLGSVFGTFFQAFHGAQGPKMGLPQMIQSRAQFGSRGAILPLVAVVFVQFGFAIFYIETGAASVATITPDLPMPVYILLVGAIGIAIATIGYRLVMKSEKVVSYLAVAALASLTICAVTFLPMGSLWDTGSFIWAPFLLQFAASATFQVAIAPAVSDYTRYLRERISGAKVSATVFCGTLASAVWIEILGAILVLAFPGQSTIGGFAELGSRVSPLFAGAVMIVSLATCLTAVAVCFYSGSLAFLTAVEGFKSMRSTVKLRAAAIITLGTLSIAAALALPEDAQAAFGVFLAVLTYFLIPWTAVNLIDYYVVRRGVLSVSDILRQDGGIYGRWGRPGMISYLVGFIAMIPFFSTIVWVGPAAKALGSADFSFAVGLIVSGGVYLFLTRNFDREAEFKLVAQAPINTLRALGKTSGVAAMASDAH